MIAEVYFASLKAFAALGFFLFFVNCIFEFIRLESFSALDVLERLNCSYGFIIGSLELIVLLFYLINILV
jgi:hypothetical protein